MWFSVEKEIVLDRLAGGGDDCLARGGNRVGCNGAAAGLRCLGRVVSENLCGVDASSLCGGALAAPDGRSQAAQLCRDGSLARAELTLYGEVVIRPRGRDDRALAEVSAVAVRNEDVLRDERVDPAQNLRAALQRPASARTAETVTSMEPSADLTAICSRSLTRPRTARASPRMIRLAKRSSRCSSPDRLANASAGERRRCRY